MRWLFVLSVFFIAFDMHENVPDGEQVFKKHCKSCHGMDGTKGSFKAADLRTSRITDSEIKSIINIGRGKMKSYKEKLSEREIEEVTEYVKGLRK